MVQPIDYTLNVLSPMQRFTEGLKFGEDVLTARLARDETQQLMGMRAAQEARAATAEQERRAAADAQRARAEKMQADLGGLVALAEGGNLTTDAINQFRLTYAETLDDVTNVFTSMEQERQKPLKDFGVKSVTLALTGNAAAAEALYQERIDAAKNAGTPEAMQEAQALEAELATLKANPINFATAQATLLRHADYINDDQLKGLLDLAKQGQGETPAKVTELNFRAKEAGLVPGTPEYREFMRRGGEVEKGPMVQNIVGAGETEFAKKAGAEAATQFSTVANQGTAASRQLVELENLEENLANVETGGAAAFKAYLGSIGVATEGLGEIQAAQAAINRLVPQQRPPGSGTMSDADLALFKASLPALINQPGGNQIIIETIRAINEYDVAASIIAGQALDGEITQAEARKRLRELPNPLADFKAPKGAAKPAPAPVVIDGVTIQRIE